MHARFVVAFLAVLLATAVPAGAQTGDPIMPLSEVQPGMKCKGYSVFKGTGVDSFDVEILEIVGGGDAASTRLLVRVSGAAIESSGIGAGFSGSPVYCPASDGKMKNAGAISETIGEFGGKTVLATPIEAIIGTAADPPARTRSAPGLLARAQPLSAPLTIRGLSRPVYLALASAGRRAGRTILQAPPPLRQAPPVQPFRPGSAMSVGLSSGSIALGAVGTVAYVDGDKVWALGHPFDAVGVRSLLLQDAYVAAVVSNPIQLESAGGTYKLAGPVNDVGTITNDGLNAVAGRIGGLPATVPVRIFARDEDRKLDVTTEVKVADETDVGSPTGASPLSFVGPVAIAQAAAGIAGSAPSRFSGEMCLRITLRERPKPMRVCNRYVSEGTGTSAPTSLGNIVAVRAGSDAAEVLAVIDSYKPTGLHVTEVSARINLRRGQRQAFMTKLKLPRRVRRGTTVPVTLAVRRVRGPKETLRFRVRIPDNLPRGFQTITLRGSNADTGDEDLFGALTITLGEPDDEEETDIGPTTMKALVREIRRIERYDGIRIGARGGRRAYKHPTLRIGGRASTDVIVTG